MISIIGGAGFIGTNIVNRLGHKYEFKIFDNGFNPSGHVDFDSLEIGTASHEELKDFLKGSDIVINLAGHTRVLESIEDPNLSFTYNVKGFFDVLLVSKELYGPGSSNLQTCLPQLAGRVNSHTEVLCGSVKVIQPLRAFRRADYEARYASTARAVRGWRVEG